MSHYVKLHTSIWPTRKWIILKKHFHFVEITEASPDFRSLPYRFKDLILIPYELYSLFAGFFFIILTHCSLSPTFRAVEWINVKECIYQIQGSFLILWTCHILSVWRDCVEKKCLSCESKKSNQIKHAPTCLCCCDKPTLSSLHLRCDLGSCSRDAASCCLPDPSRYCHGDRFSRRHPDEDAEDADPATHHFQFNHRCGVTTSYIKYASWMAYFTGVYNLYTFSEFKIFCP